MKTASMLSIALLCAAPAVAHAQNPTPPAVTLDLHDVPVRAALEQLFASVKADYSIDPRITGTVTLKVTGLPFDAALKLVMRSSTVPLTYTRENGVYEVRPRTVTVTETPPSAPVTVADDAPRTKYEVIELVYADPVDLAGVLNITMIPIFTRAGLNVPGATGIIKPGKPGGNGTIVKSGGGNGSKPGGGAPGGVAF